MPPPSLGMGNLIRKNELEQHVCPPIDFCPIPWGSRHKNKPLGYWFDEEFEWRSKKQRELSGVVYPSRGQILAGSFCCPTFVASAYTDPTLQFHGDVRVHAKELPGTLVDYLRLSVPYEANHPPELKDDQE
jgi:hypothetical protein